MPLPPSARLKFRRKEEGKGRKGVECMAMYVKLCAVSLSIKEGIRRSKKRNI